MCLMMYSLIRSVLYVSEAYLFSEFSEMWTEISFYL